MGIGLIKEIQLLALKVNSKYQRILRKLEKLESVPVATVGIDELVSLIEQTTATNTYIGTPNYIVPSFITPTLEV